MYLVTAIIKAHRVEAVTDGLKGIGVAGMTISDVQGFGRQRGHTEVYRGHEYNIDFQPKVRVDVLCDDSSALALKVPLDCQHTVAAFVANSSLITSRFRAAEHTVLLRPVTCTV